MTALAKKIKRALPRCLWVGVTWQEPMGYECWAVVAHFIGGERRVLIGGQSSPRQALRRAWRDIEAA